MTNGSKLRKSGTALHYTGAAKLLPQGADLLVTFSYEYFWSEGSNWGARLQ